MPKKIRTEAEVAELKEKQRKYSRDYAKKVRSDPYRYAQQLERSRERYHENLERSRKNSRERAARYRAKKKAMRDNSESERVKKWQLEHPLWVADNNLKAKCRKQGISVDEYKRLIGVQSGVCAACGRPETKFKYLSVDKDSDKVRGLLCSACTAGIGKFNGDYNRMLDAAEYLIKNSTANPA